MLTDSYRTRGAAFAFLVGPPKSLTRQDGMHIHSAVCEALGANDIAFQFRRDELQPGIEGGFSIQLDRQEGREKLVVEIGSSTRDAPVRLLFRYDWPASNQHVFEDFDLAFDAVHATIGEGWQRVLAEARLQGQVDVVGGSAVSFLDNDILRVLHGTDRSRDLSFLSFKYESNAAHFTERDQLANPKRDVTVEVLREDPRCLYLEVMSQWPQVAVSLDGTVEVGPGRVRAFRSPPSEYLANTITYVDTVVLPLLARTDQTQG